LAGLTFFQGTLSAADIYRVPFADPLAALQVLLASGIAVPAFIGSATAVTLLYYLLGGRTFCSWVCPVYLLTEFGDKIREKLQTGRMIFSMHLKQGLLLLTFIATAVTGLPLFETISPIGIAARVAAFGLWSGLLLLAGIVVVEIMFARRIWCRSLCPLGAYYAIIGRYSPLKVSFTQDCCTNCGECTHVCPVEEVLEPSLQNGAKIICSGECTGCGLCIDVCAPKALKVSYGLQNIIFRRIR
jgi:ferredoxin-type protein NapH